MFDKIKKRKLNFSILGVFILVSIFIFAFSCGGGGGGVSAARGGNNAGKGGKIGSGSSGSDGVKVFVNGQQVAGEVSSGSSGESGMSEKAKTASYSEGINSLNWSVMNLKVWVNGELCFDQNINKGDDFSIDGLKLGDNIKAEGRFTVADPTASAGGEDYLIKGEIASLTSDSKLSMYVTYTYSCQAISPNFPALNVVGNLDGTYTAESGAKLPTVLSLDGRTVLGWKNTTTGLSSNGKIWKNIPAGTTGNLTFTFDPDQCLAGTGLFELEGTTIKAIASGANISNLVIPEGITGIAYSAFNNNTSITSVTIPSTLSLPGNGFWGCTNLKTVTFAPNSSLKEISTCMFTGTAISSITVPEGVTSLSTDSFSNCQNLTSVSLPSSLTSIGQRAFGTCPNLTSITIPENVNKIDIMQGTFNTGASSLTLTLKPSTPPTLLYGSGEIQLQMAFKDTPNYTIRVPSASLNAYKTATGWSCFADKIVGY